MLQITNNFHLYQSITLNDRQLCDLELLLNGGFHPLKGFLTEKDYKNVVDNLRLTTGEFFPIPIILSIDDDKVDNFKHDKYVTLRDKQGIPLSVLVIKDIYKPNLFKECLKVYGTIDTNHPYVNIILSNPDVHYIGGTLLKIRLPQHYDFMDLRLTPSETKNYFIKNNWKTIVGFQTRNPMHRSHMELTKYALSQTGDKDAKLLIHPVVGITQSCDVDYHVRVRCYKKLIKHYPENVTKLSLLPLSMRMAGPREAALHAIIRQNYGCTHFCVGRDHAGPSFKDKEGKSFYGPYDAHDLLEKYKNDLKIKIIKSKWIVFVKETQSYMKIDEVPKNMTIMNISGTEQRKRLANNEEIPEWFSFPNIVNELRKNYRPKLSQGFYISFFGLSGSGKSTLANALKSRLLELESERKISLLDGDVIRLNLSKGLGFSKEDRSTNVRRVGYVASEIVKHGGIAISALVSPYVIDRQYNKGIIKNNIEILVGTSLGTCEKRDVKGLYKLARAGKIKNFTGIDDPFEKGIPDLIIKEENSIEENINVIIDKLRELGYFN